MPTFPDPFQGKEYHTEQCCNGSGAAIRVVDLAYGYEESGMVAKVCQENTTYAEAGGSATGTTMFYYDMNLSGSTLSKAAASYLFGNQTDVFEYDFNQTVPLSQVPYGAGYVRRCPGTLTGAVFQPAAPPTPSLRWHHTDYLQSSGYTGSPAYLPSLPIEHRVFSGAGAQLSQEVVQYDTTATQNPQGNYGSAVNAAYCGSASQSYRGNIGSMTNGIGSDAATDLLTYDCVGNVFTHADPKQNVTTFGYADRFTTSPGAGPTYAYRTSIQLPNGASVARTYDWFTGHVRGETDKNGLTTAFDYTDPLNRLKQITRGSALGGTIAASTVVAYTDVPVSGTTPVSVQVNKDQYGSGDQRLQTTTQYDAFGRDAVSTVSGAETIKTVTQYDGLGRVYQRCNPVNAAGASTTDGCTTLTYDAAGRQTVVSDPDGSSASNVYSVLTSGSTTVRTSQTTDEAGVQKTLQYDGLGRLTGVVEAVDTAAYTYDALDDLMSVSQTDASGTGSNSLVQQRSFTYDSLKRLKYSMNPETGAINYTYDANGNLVTKADGRFTTCYGNLSGSACDGSGYDSLNRATHISFTDSNTASVRICYDGYAYSANTGACGTTQAANQWMRKTASAAWLVPGGTIADVSFTSYSYDLAGRLTGSTQTTGGVPYPFVYSYYNDDQLASIQYPSSRLVTTCYDQNERVAWVDGTLTPATCVGGGSASSKAYAAVQSYWPQGAINQATLGNGLVEQDGFNNRLQMVTKAAALGGVSRLGLTLSYCASPATTCSSGNNGNLLWQSIGYAATTPEPGGLNVTQTYGYDGVNRLTGFMEGSNSQTHNYDGFGNRWVTSSMPLSDLTPQYQTAFLPASGAPTNRLLAKTYDLSGNQQELDPFTLTYDAENRVMTAVAASPVGITESYAYDGEGRRVQKTGFVSTVFVYDGFGNLAAEYGAAGTASGTQFLTADHLGSTRLVTDVNGNVVARYDYLPFGEGMGAGLDGRSTLYSIGAYPGSSDGLDVKFTGKERDAESGLDYFKARYLSSAQGRFTSPDPLVLYSATASDPQSWNKYAYARNNPLLYTDPDGQTFRICDTSGNCDDNYSDANFYQNLDKTSNNGIIYDNNGTKIGTYERTSFDDLGPLGNSLYFGMAARRQASNQMIGAFAAGSVAVGTGGGLIASATGLTAGSGLTSLEIGSVASEGAASQLVAADLTYTQTVANNFAQAGGRARPYDLKLVVQEIMESGSPKPDPGGIAGGLSWDVPGTMNGSKGVYELVVNPTTKQIVHFVLRA